VSRAPGPQCQESVNALICASAPSPPASLKMTL